MINCPKCGSNIKEGEKVCKVCGTEIINSGPNENIIGGNNQMEPSMQAPVAPTMEQPMQAPVAPTMDQPMQAPVAPAMEQPMPTPVAPTMDQPMQGPMMAPAMDQPIQAPVAPGMDQPMQAPTAPAMDQSMQGPMMAPAMEQPMPAPVAPTMEQSMQEPMMAPAMEQPMPAPTAPVVEPQANQMAQPQANQMAQPQANQMAQPQANQMASNDDQLIDAYIGKNAEKLKKGDFSFCTFLFGNIYIFYRKMWQLGIALFVVSSIVGNFLPSYAYLITLVIDILLAIKFKSMYLKHVKEQVNKIKSSNPNASQNELLNICGKKGGTTLAPVIILFVIYLILIGIAIAAFINTAE